MRFRGQYLAWLWWALLCVVAGAKPQLGICVTGQRSRLEFWSKVFHVIVPNMESYEIDILFVLDASKHESVNGGREQLKGMPALLLDESTIESSILRYCPTCGVLFDFRSQPQNPVPVAQYMQEMDKFTTNTLRRQRAVLNARNMHTWSRCFEVFHEHTRVSGKKYDVFLRIREDSYALLPMRISRDMWENTVSVTEGCDFGGYNDKQAILDNRFAYSYFVKPLQNFYMFYPD